MPPETERRGWLIPAFAAVLALTLWRVLLLPHARLDLFVDEAQYWLWSQDLAWGYYSKPPLIGWVIAAFTAIGGSDSPFWIRLPGPLLHGLTALLLGAVAARLYGRRVAVLTAVTYVSLPMVAVASLLISTDTVLFPGLALALLLWLRVIGGQGAGLAAPGAGAALGLAFLGKYAAVYYLLGAGLAALVIPSARPAWRDAGLALLAFAAVIAPNLIWNAANGFSTLQHTVDNADWLRDPGQRAGANPASLAGFLAAQFAVMGPVVFGAWLIAAVLALRRGGDRTARLLLCFSLPVLLIVCAQAFLSRAYANWAASAWLAGTILAVALLARGHRVWLILALGINLAVALLLPLAATRADTLRLGGNLLLGRYVGRDEVSRHILDTAAAQRLAVVVAENRDILADLFHTGRDSGLSFRALAGPGRAPHHYALKFPYVARTGEPVLLITTGDTAPGCGAVLLWQDSPYEGAWRRKTISAWRIDGGCLK